MMSQESQLGPIAHVPRKLLNTVDALSRDPVPNQEPDFLQEEVETYVNSITRISLPATQQRLDTYCQSQKQHPVCSQVRELCKTGWPKKQLVPQELMPYWKVKDSLTICDNLLYCTIRELQFPSRCKKTLYRGYTQVILGSRSARSVHHLLFGGLVLCSRLPSSYGIARCVPRKAAEGKSH